MLLFVLEAMAEHQGKRFPFRLWVGNDVADTVTLLREISGFEMRRWHRLDCSVRPGRSLQRTGGGVDHRSPLLTHGEQGNVPAHPVDWTGVSFTPYPGLAYLCAYAGMFPGQNGR